MFKQKLARYIALPAMLFMSLPLPAQKSLHQLQDEFMKPNSIFTTTVGT